MAVQYSARFIFTDEKGNTTSRTHKAEFPGVDMAVEFSDFVLDAEALLADYRAASTAGVHVVYTILDEDHLADAPAAGSDVSDVAHVNTFIEGPPSEKLWALSVPSPIPTMFIGGSAGTEVDPDNVELVALVAELASEWEVSDGETIDTGINDGIKDGEWRSRKYNPR